MNKDIFNSINILKNLYTVHTPRLNPDNAKPVHLRRFLDDISVRVDRFGVLEPTIDLNELYQHARICFARKTNDFTIRELNNLPFILFKQGMSMPMFKYLLYDCIDCTRESRLVKLLHIYFTNYQEDARINLLKQKIASEFKTKNKASFFKKVLQCAWQFRFVLFASKPEAAVCELYNRNGLNVVLDEFGIKDKHLRSSKFVQASLRCFYADAVAHQAKYAVFEELRLLDFEGYDSVKPDIVSNLIMITDVTNDVKWKEKLMSFCMNTKNFGDPRRNRNKWLTIAPKARRTFLKWLASDDLELFFKIIEKTAVDRMWRYRSKFWKAYLPYISNTWVFLGRIAEQAAKQIADDKTLYYGKPTGGVQANHSAFIFQINDYIFCEWSHNGKLYIWDKDSYAVERAIVAFGNESISKADVTSSDFSVAYSHFGSQEGRWQNQVSQWIASHCNIYKSQKDWR